MQLIHYVKIGEIHTTLRTKGSRIGSSKCPSACNFITSRTTLHVIHYNQSQMPKQKKKKNSTVLLINYIVHSDIQCVFDLSFPFTIGMTPIFLQQHINSSKSNDVNSVHFSLNNQHKVQFCAAFKQTCNSREDFGADNKINDIGWQLKKPQLDEFGSMRRTWRKEEAFYACRLESSHHRGGA